MSTSAVYVGAGSDIRRPFNTLREIQLFVCIDYERGPEFFSEILHECLMEDLQIIYNDQLYDCDELPQHIQDNPNLLYSINPLIFIHPTTKRRIHYYHSIVIPDRSIAWYAKELDGCPDYPIDIIREDVAKCNTIIDAGHHPYDIILMMMGRFETNQIDLVTYKSTCYQRNTEEDNIYEYERRNVIEYFYENPEILRKIIYFPVQSCYLDEYRHHYQTYDPDNHFIFQTMEELCDFMDENSSGVYSDVSSD
jgi:hypothetical protein